MSLKDTFLKTVTDNLLLEIAALNIPGYSVQRKFFRSEDLGNNIMNDIWSYAPSARIYTYTADVGADYYLVAEDDTDTQLTSVIFQDELGNEFVASYQLNGNTPIKINDLSSVVEWLGPNRRATTFKCTRCYRVENLNSIDYKDNIFVTEGNGITAGVPDTPGDVRAHIGIISSGGLNLSANKTLMAPYRIPNEYYGFFIKAYTSILKPTAGVVDFSLWARDKDSVFKVESSLSRNSQGTSDGDRELLLPQIISPRADVTIRGVASAVNTGAAGMYQILLIHQDFVGQAIDLMTQNGKIY